VKASASVPTAAALAQGMVFELAVLALAKASASVPTAAALARGMAFGLAVPVLAGVAALAVVWVG